MVQQLTIFDTGGQVHQGPIRYKISSTNGSSQKYGTCEKCGKFCATVYHQSSERYFEFTDKYGKLYSGWGVRAGLYGCEKCLLESRQ